MIPLLVSEVSVVLAEAGPNNAPANNPEWGKAAPTGLFVLLVFVLAAFFLFRSMNRHIKRVDTGFSSGSASALPDAHLGSSHAPVPVLDNVDLSTQTSPRLGTPAEVEALEKAKRQAKLRKARARRDKS